MSDRAQAHPASRPIRAKNRFVDDSAVESDGEGGDIPSTATTPQNSRPSSPAYTPSSHISVQLLIKKKRSEKAKCSDFNRQFAGPLQLIHHLTSNKHRRKIASQRSGHCKICNQVFTTKHNLKTHKCKNFLKSETFYKL